MRKKESEYNMLLAIKPELYPILIALLCVFIPTFVLSIVIFVKKIIKFSKEQRINYQDDDYKELFGGNDNIENVEVKMTRVIIQVKDLDKVNLEGLKAMNIGVLIAGNTVKCSSKEFADRVLKTLE